MLIRLGSDLFKDVVKRIAPIQEWQVAVTNPPQIQPVNQWLNQVHDLTCAPGTPEDLDRAALNGKETTEKIQQDVTEQQSH